MPSTPGHGPSPSVSSVSGRFRTHQTNNSITSIASVSSSGTLVEGTVTQQRRLAEFATMLGDYKLAISVWEALRKEGRGGSVGFYFHSCIRGNPHTSSGRTSYPPSTVPSSCPSRRTCNLSTTFALKSPLPITRARTIARPFVCSTLGSRNRQTRLYGINIGRGTVARSGRWWCTSLLLLLQLGCGSSLRLLSASSQGKPRGRVGSSCVYALAERLRIVQGRRSSQYAAVCTRCFLERKERCTAAISSMVLAGC